MTRTLTYEATDIQKALWNLNALTAQQRRAVIESALQDHGGEIGYKAWYEETDRGKYYQIDGRQFANATVSHEGGGTFRVTLSGDVLQHDPRGDPTVEDTAPSSGGSSDSGATSPTPSPTPTSGDSSGSETTDSDGGLTSGGSTSTGGDSGGSTSTDPVIRDDVEAVKPQGNEDYDVSTPEIPEDPVHVGPDAGSPSNGEIIENRHGGTDGSDSSGSADAAEVDRRIKLFLAGLGVLVALGVTA